jgi:hypothetical protein
MYLAACMMAKLDYKTTNTAAVKASNWGTGAASIFSSSACRMVIVISQIFDASTTAASIYRARNIETKAHFGEYKVRYNSVTTNKSSTHTNGDMPSSQ